VLNTISDYITGTGQSAYHNCMPGGIKFPDPPVAHPDFSGITIEGSPQRRWFDKVSDSPHDWKIAVGHRPPWCAYDNDPRKMNKSARPAFVTPVANGLSLGLFGDVHIGSFSGKWLPEPPDYETYTGDDGPGL